MAKHLHLPGAATAASLWAAAACAATFTFPYTLEQGGLTAGGIYNEAGRLVCPLWGAETREAGSHEAVWNGRDSVGRPAAPGTYRLRVVVNRSTYENVAQLGNTGSPGGEMQHIQHGVSGIFAGADGILYTANGWEEAGHDFKVFDPGGKTLFHARYQIRNGDPNGAPHAITADDAFIYCATFGWANEHSKSRKQIQRFDIRTGDLVPFTDPSLAGWKGHIQLYEWPERSIPEGTPAEDAALLAQPIQDLAVFGDHIYATDAIAGQVRVFDKETGAEDASAAFAVRLPHDIAIDAEGRFYVAHEHTKVSRFNPDGTFDATLLEDVRTASLCMAPGGELCVADGESCQVRFFDVSGKTAEQTRAFGGPAAPGTARPDQFYSLVGAGVDAQGNLTTLGSVPCGGARIGHFAPDGTCLWEHLALAFCDSGSYNPARPDEFLTQRFHRIRLGDKDKGEWTYEGTVLDGDPGYLYGNHGVPAHLAFNGIEFLYQCYGDSMQIYRRTGEGLYRLAAMVGSTEPHPDGRYNHDLPEAGRKPPNLWCWSDLDGDGKVQDDEVDRQVPPEETRYAIFGMNADADGTLVYCEHHTQAVWELPLAGFDGRGNPRYDWRQARMIIPRDESPARFFPLMAQRAGDGSLYAEGRSALFRPDGPGAGNIWMGGWVLARYTKENRLEWITPMPGVTPGFCVVPGGRGGVMLGHFLDGEVYHYEPGGLHVGTFKPGEPAGFTSGWMDNTAAVCVNRDPRDGKLDAFIEDSWLNRILWYRIDDSDMSELFSEPQEIPPMNARTIVCLGDSITDGETYALLLKQALHEAGLPVPVTVAAGIGGDTADGMLRRLEPDVLSYKPDLVIFNAGVNDAMRGKSAGQFATECAAIFDAILASGARVLPMTPVVIAEQHAGTIPLLEELVAAMRDEADKRGLRYADVHAAMERDLRAGGAPLISPDGIHLEFPGYRTMVRELLDALGYADVPVPQTLDVPTLPGLVTEWVVWAMPADRPAADAPMPVPEGEGHAMTLPRQDGAASWWPDQERRRGVAVELDKVAGEGRWYFSKATVHSDGARDAWLVPAAEPLLVWLNGERVWAADPSNPRGWHPGHTRVPVELRAGDNEIAIASGAAFVVCLTPERDGIDRDFGQE
jgi:acyl-CoA thioesterase-1